MKKQNLEIFGNCVFDNPACAICGGWIEPFDGPELRLSGTGLLVCHACGMKHDPKLTKALRRQQERITKARKAREKLFPCDECPF